MENNHLTYFKIENFKKFDSLEVKDIGQFNLIVGDNNVGKTCLLEALSIGNSPKEIISSLYHILMSRKDSDYYDKIKLLGTPYYAKGELHPILEELDNHRMNILTTVLKDESKPLVIDNSKIKVKIENWFYQYDEANTSEIQKPLKQFIEEKELFTYPEIHKKSKNWLVFYENDKLRFLADITSKYYVDFFFKKPFSNIVYFSSRINNDNVLRYEMRIDDFDVKQDIVKTLNDLFKLSILDFEFRKSEFAISTNDNKVFHSIKRYGEGIQRVVLFYLEILCNENNILFIDEIEIGLHHTKQGEFWKNILKICAALNVQLFATTHSRECAEAYVNAAKKLDLKIQNQVRLIELYNLKDKVESITISGLENIDYTIKNEPFRGENIYV